MAVTMPKISVIFQQKAASLMTRSERGIAILIVKDDTNKEFTHKQYTDLTALEADKELYTAENYSAISDMLMFAPYQSHVFPYRCGRVALRCTFRNYPDGKKRDGLRLQEWIRKMPMLWSSWIKSQEARYKSYKAVVYQAGTAPDSMHIVNFVNETVTFSDDRGEKSGVYYLPSLLAIFAICNVTRGCTNYLCSNLSLWER